MHSSNLQKKTKGNHTNSGHIPAPMCNLNRLLISVNVCWRWTTSRRLTHSRLSINFITGSSHDDDSLLGNRDDDRCPVMSSPWLHMKYISSRQRETLTLVTSLACHDMHSITTVKYMESYAHFTIIKVHFVISWRQFTSRLPNLCYSQFVW